MRLAATDVSRAQIEAFCRRWKVAEMSLFGSAIRDDFRPDSDVDVLVSLEPGEEMTLEKYMDMRDELSSMFGGRQIDLVQKRLVTNRFRRARILANREVLYGG